MALIIPWRNSAWLDQQSTVPVADILLIIVVNSPSRFQMHLPSRDEYNLAQHIIPNMLNTTAFTHVDGNETCSQRPFMIVYFNFILVKLNIWINELGHFCLRYYYSRHAEYKRVGQLGRHWFRYCLYARSAPSHYLKWCSWCRDVNLLNMTKSRGFLNADIYC